MVEMMKLKLVLKENKLINEITLDDARDTWYSKATSKRIFQYLMMIIEEKPHLYIKTNDYLGSFDEQIEIVAKNIFQELQANFFDSLSRCIPNDLEDSEKGLSMIWLKNISLSSYGSFKKFLGGEINLSGYNHYLEKFFQFKRFLNPEHRDLNRIEDINELVGAVELAKSKYEVYQAKKINADAAVGTEKIYEDQEWNVYIANNKGAACELGKGTEWCTAAPGLDYYENYAKPDDPLFIFISKIDPTSKFQFNYGSGQFMDKNDFPILNMRSVRDIERSEAMRRREVDDAAHFGFATAHRARARAEKQEKEEKEKEEKNKLFLNLHTILDQTVGDRFPIIRNTLPPNGFGPNGFGYSYIRKGASISGGEVTSFIDIETGKQKRENNKATKIVREFINVTTKLGFISFWFSGGESNHQLHPTLIKLEAKYDEYLEKSLIFSLSEVQWIIANTEIASYISANKDTKEFHLEIKHQQMWNNHCQKYFEENIEDKEEQYANMIYKDNMV